MNRVYTVGQAISFVSRYVAPGTLQPKNPASVVARILDPHGIEQRPAVTSNEVGTFETIYTPQEAGQYHLRWEAKGVTASAQEYSFTVNPSPFA